METVVSHGAGCLKRIVLLPDITKKRISFIRTMRAVRRARTTTAERKSGIKTSNLGTSCANRNIETHGLNIEWRRGYLSFRYFV